MNNAGSRNLFNNFGPALLVTAAFIGPGTVLTASKAGANFGFALIWAVVFSIIATIALQEMAARLGIVTGGGLAKAIQDTFANPFLRYIAIGLVLTAILIGNAAYQTGNLLGAATGLNELFPVQAGTEAPEAPAKGWQVSQAGIGAILFGIIAIAVIWIGRIELLKWLMMALVTLMSIMFVWTAIASNPDWSAVAAGLIPRIPGVAAEAASGEGGEQVANSGFDFGSMSLFVIGLIGTTVVPYNLFLHASSAAEKWPADSESEKRLRIQASFWDTAISVLIGGVVTGSILITMAVAFEGASPPTKANEVAAQLGNSQGDWARVVFAIGLCAAGLSSAITAPVAAAYATAGCFGWPCKLADIRLKWVATVVVLVGVVLAVGLGSSPLRIIVLAQVANGLLLPLVAVFLLYVANQSRLMGNFKNSIVANVFGTVVILVAFAMAAKTFIGIFG